MNVITKPLSQSDKESLEKLFAHPGFAVLLNVLNARKTKAMIAGAEKSASQFVAERNDAASLFENARKVGDAITILQETVNPETHIKLEILP